MKSYDDLQRFKEKTHTTHIEFKDLSEQSRNSDNTNWAIIKQLASDGADTIFENSQTINIVTPQLADPSAFVAPTTPAAPVAEPLPSFKALGQSAEYSGSLLDSIASSLKPSEQPDVAKSEPPAAQGDLPVQATAEQALAQLKKVAELRPETVAHAGHSLFDQLAQQSPSVAVPTVTRQETKPAQQPFSEPAEPKRNSSSLQQVSAESLHQLLQETRPLHPDYPSRPVQPLNAELTQQQQWAPAQNACPPVQQPLMAQRGYAPPQPDPQFARQPLSDSLSRQPGYPYQSQHMPSQPTMPGLQPHRVNNPMMQRTVTAAAASPNISYKHLFSPAGEPVNQANSKEMPLQSLLEKIASCR